MANQTSTSPELLAYVRAVSLRDDEILKDLRATTAELPAGSALQVMAELGQLLGLLVALTGAREVLEVGTYTGYSSLCLARALPADGRLTTCDVTRRWPMIAQEYWERAGVADRIDVRVADAPGTLAGLLTERGAGAFDLAFVDADKKNYGRYYEAVLALLRPGGLMVLDNTLFFGRVIDPAAQDPDTVAIRELNLRLRDDDRIDMSLLPMADGVTLARKRA